VNQPGGADGPARSRGLSFDRIVTQTLELIDELGIAAVSMRTVGQRLGVRGMSLYRYVASREELFDAVVERIVDELAADPRVRLRPDDGWRDYLSRLAAGVRRYARAHPHAFPLVATRPPGAPWINPPLRSLRWIEAMLSGLQHEGFTDDQVLFTYRTFNSFLLGFLLLETSANVLRDPRPGDGSFQSGTDSAATDPVDPVDPVPGGLSPTRRRAHRRQLADAESPGEYVDPVGEVDAESFPIIHRLAAGLTESHYDAEFRSGLDDLLDRVDGYLAQTSRPRRRGRGPARR
jgi:AcrR family transcriptional regulator